MLNVAEDSPAIKPASAFVGFSDDHRLSVWLDMEVAKSKAGWVTQPVALTPALARVLLGRNPSNRTIKEYLVDTFARDIEHGRWEANGEAVIVSNCGHLIDGQHRCLAVLRADRAIKVTLVIGPDYEARKSTNQGSAKTLGDYLSMDGHKQSTQLGAATGFIIQHRTRGQIWTSGKPTKSECMAFIAEHEDIEKSVQFVNKKGADAYGGRSMLAFCHWTIWDHTKDRAAADAFINKLVNGEGLLAKDPILYCRNRLISERGRLRANDRAELLFRTWNAHRGAKEVARQLPILGGALPELEA